MMPSRECLSPSREPSELDRKQDRAEADGKKSRKKSNGAKFLPTFAPTFSSDCDRLKKIKKTKPGFAAHSGLRSS